MDSREFRSLYCGDLETPIASLRFEVWRIGERLAKGKRHFWCMGVHFGPNADGTLAAYLQMPPSAVRRARLREISEAASFPAQVGFPASINTHAGIGYSCTVGRSSRLAFQVCGAQRSPLVRQWGQPARGHRAGNKEFAQRAKRISRSGHLASHTSAFRLRTHLGPFAPLRRAGCNFGQSLVLWQVGVWRLTRTTGILGISLRVGTGRSSR